MVGEHGDSGWHAGLSPPCPLPGPCAVADVKESRKDVLPVAEGPSGEVHVGDLARSTELAQSQVSLQSASSVGSTRGDEGATYADVYGDYRPLFDNAQDPDNVSLQGGGCGWLGLVGSPEGGVGPPAQPPSLCRG